MSDVPDDAPRESAALPAPSRFQQLRARTRRARRLLRAPLLATFAVGVHWMLNVPPGVKVSDKDQGAAKGDKKAKPKPKKKKGGFEPRPIGEVEASWERYREVEFDAEPVKSAWARPTQTLVSKAVTLARTTAFEGAPEEPRVTVSDVECHTIRCRFVLRSPFTHEVDMLVDTLSHLETDGASIWRGFSHERIDPPTPQDAKTDTYLRVTIAFREDSMDSATFEVPKDAVAGDSDDARPRPRAEVDTDDDEENVDPDSIPKDQLGSAD